MSAIENLRNRIDLEHIPFTERGSRLLLFRKGSELRVQLVERWVKWEQEVGHYRQRPPLIEHFTLLGADETPLDFELETYPHLIRLSTAVGLFDWTFIDPETLLVRLPAGRYGFQFSVWADEAQADRRGGTFHGKRHFAYTTNAHLTRNEIVSQAENPNHFQVSVGIDAAENGALLLNVTPRLGFNRSIPGAGNAIAEARARWQAWFDAAPPVLDIYQKHYFYAWWMMRSGLLATRYYFTREALPPSKIHYVGVWHWDQFFHAIAYRYVDTRLAEDQIRIVLDHQRPDGMLPDAIYDEGLVTHLTAPVDEDVTKPPLAAWTVLKLFEKSGHYDFLEEVYEPLLRWHNWWTTACMNGCGLCEYRHPFSSGLDDSPLWDGGMPVVSPDLNTYIYIQQESLARIAELLGNSADAARFRADAAQWAQRLVNELWDEERGWFVARHDDAPIPILTLFNLLPLWTGQLPPAIVERLLGHLTNPAEFWTEWPLPTVAVSDSHFDPMQMWRGPTWVNINYLFIEALTRCGQHDLARQLRRKTLDLLMRHADIYEYYNPLTGERPPKAAPMYGWSAALFIELAIQETRAVLRPEGTSR
jgi:glycogen debranching enzyme